MKSVFDKPARDELISRVRSLNDRSPALWGKMNVYQMLRHCRLWEEMIQGGKPHRRGLAARLFGKMVLKSVMKNDATLRKNSPTIPELKIGGNGDVSMEKATWISRIGDYEHFTDNGFVHPFFGKMTREQIGYLVYKHADHHLRQFGA